MTTKLLRTVVIGLLTTWFSMQAASAGGTPDWTNSLGNSINWLSISGDGNVIFTGTFLFKQSGNFGVYCLDKTGAIKWKDTTLTNNYTGVNWTGLSQDGQYGAAGGWYDTNSHTGFLRVYQTSGGALLTDDRPPGRVEGIAVSSNGVWTASCSKDLRLYQVRTIRLPIFQKKPVLPAPFSWRWYPWPIWRLYTYCVTTSTNRTSGEQFHSVAMSQDGHWIVAGGSGPNDTGGKVRLFENQQGTLNLVQTWYTNLASIYYIQSLDMTPDGNWFAACFDGKMLMFNRTNFAATGQPSWGYSVNGSGKSVWTVRVSTNGAVVAAASNGLNAGGKGVCLVKNLAGVGGSYSPQLLWSSQTTSTPNPGLSMDANAKYVVVADGYPPGQAAHFYLLNATNGAQIWNYQTPNMNWPIAISSDGKSIAGGGDNGVIYHWKN